MKKAVEKILFVFTVITLLVVCFAFSASAYYYGNFEYELISENTVKITDYNGKAEELIIPEKIYDRSVIEIDDYAFKNYTNLVSITIPKSVTRIGREAFDGCTSLMSIEFPDNLITIGAQAFYGCTSLTSIELPDNLTTIGAQAFYGCKYLTSVKMSNNVTTIGYEAFKNCSSLVNITIPNKLIVISEGVFSCCASLISITVPDNVGIIYPDAFYGCSSLASIKILNPLCNIYDSDRTIPSKTFIYCRKGSRVVSYAEKYNRCFILFNGTEEENTITCNEPIGNYSWFINKITGVMTLEGTGEMVDFMTTTPPWYDYLPYVKEILLPDTLTTIGAKAFKDFKYLKNVKIPNNVSLIGPYAFYDCRELTSITIPENVNQISERSFSGCSALANITISDGVKNIGYAAFAGCLALTNITIPESITTIHDFAFGNCSALTNITIPASVMYLDSDAFIGCTCLGSVTFAQDEKKQSQITKMPNLSETKIKEIVLPASIGYIVDYIGCKGFPNTIEKVTIYNPECKLTSDCGLDYTHTIIGFKGSTAETFAAQVEATFIDIETVHSHSYKTIETIESTCSKEGKITERCICGKEKETAVPKPDHIEVTIKGKDATCTTTGLTEGSYCLECEAIIVEQEVISSLGHLYIGKVTTEPTCTNKGVMRYTCENDTNHTFTEEIDELGHDKNKHSARMPTCTKIGWNAYETCSRCEYSTYIEIPALNHNYIGVLTTEPTCTTKGVITYTCKNNANHTYTEETNELGHDKVKHNAKAPTCTEIGWNEYETCSRCEYSTYVELPLTEHGYTQKVTEPTCVYEGFTTHTCLCGNSYISDIIPATEHKNETTIIQATFTQSGKVETKCTVCDELYSLHIIHPIKTIKLSSTSVTYNGSTRSPSITVKDIYGNTLKNGTDYTVSIPSGRKLPGIYEYKIIFKGNYEGEKTLIFTISPKAPTSISATQSTSVINLKWTASVGATGYRVYQYSPSKGKYVQIASVKGVTSYRKATNLKAGTEYKFKIKPYTKLSDGTVIWGTASEAFATATECKAPKITSVTSPSKSKATVKWSNVDGETGFQLYYSTKKTSGYKKINSYSANKLTGSKTFSSSASGKTIYFKVRAYKKVNGQTIFGEWSAVKSVKLK